MKVRAAADPVHVVDGAADIGDDEEIPIERWEEFHVSVEQLPADQREVFSLIWYLGLDQEAAAKSLGCSLRTVSRRWAEAREAVQKAIGGTKG